VKLSKCGWIAVLLAIPVLAQPSWEQKALADVAEALKKTGAPSVSVVIIEDGKIAFSKAFGKADLASNRVAELGTRYAVGSISKQFTVAALLLLQEEGKLSLDDKVARFFPDLTQANQVTVRQLLSHTAGYEDFAPQDYLIPEWTHPTTSAEILQKWARKPLNFDPGTRWQYSNTGYVLAGSIVEKASGKPLVEFLREKFLNPLGMGSAGDCNDRGAADATAYTRFALGPPRPVGREAKGWYEGAGELCMTAPDLGKWDLAFLQHKILSPSSYEEFTREVRLQNGDSTHYALGLSVRDFRGMPMLSHGGEVSGFLALDEMFPTRNGAIIVLSNEDGISFAGPLADQLVQLVFLSGQPEESPADTARVRGVLEELRRGKVQTDQFTENARGYFTPEALRDIRKSLAGLGPLKSVSRSAESLRGGMTFRSYRAEFANKTVELIVYVTPDGKFEQFMVLESL
jgi:CubicO group peptidase (beta-lactamase class C family)